MKNYTLSLRTHTKKRAKAKYVHPSDMTTPEVAIVNQKIMTYEIKIIENDYRTHFAGNV